MIVQVIAIIIGEMRQILIKAHRIKVNRVHVLAFKLEQKALIMRKIREKA